MMKEGYNTNNMKRSNTAIAGGVLALLVLCFLASCQSDEIESGRCNIVPEFVQQHGTVITTRALLNGYTEYTPASNNVIYAYAQEFETGTELVQGDFSYNASSNRWNSTLDLENLHKYYLYAYQPAGISTKDNTTFSAADGGGHKLTATVNTITTGDPTISVAVARMYYVESNYNYNDPTPVPGDFVFGPISNNSANPDKVILAMNHLYAQASLNFKIDATYSQLRKIVITGIKARTTLGQATMDVKFSASPAPTWGTPTESNLEVDIPIQGDSIILTTDFQAAPVATFCYMPVAASNLPIELEVTYNVYHSSATLPSNNTGEWLIRKQQHAVNGRIMPSANPAAGTNYPINITVNPTYLYQLSDDDAGIELTIE